MGFSLADFGLMGAGYNEVMDADRARRYSAEDRTFQLAERERKQREAIAAEQDAERRRAYEAELRAEMPKFLATGEEAIPARAAVPAQQLDPTEVDQGAIARAAVPAAPAQPNEEAMYRRFQEIAAKHGRLDHHEAMKERLKKYQDEGVLDFIKKARQGAGETELVETFNKNGKVKLAGLRKVDDDDYVGVTSDGKDVSLNTSRMIESLLGPKDLIAHTDRTEKTAAALEAKRIGLEQQDRANAARAGERTANIGLREAQAELARARAGAADRGKPDKPRNWTSFDNEIGKAATDLSTSNDAGKKVVDHARKASIKSMAQALARANPEDYASPGAAVDAAVERLDEVRAQAAARATREVQQNPGAPGAFKESPDQFVRRRTDEIAKNELRTATPAKAKAAAASPAPSGAPKKGDVIDGYRFKGGNPNDKSNWERA